MGVCATETKETYNMLKSFIGVHRFPWDLSSDFLIQSTFLITFKIHDNEKKRKEKESLEAFPVQL